jgi:hypothetical protein
LIELAGRYIETFERITGRAFEFTGGDPLTRLEHNLNEYFRLQADIRRGPR